MRTYTHVINGETVQFPRGRSKLTDDAILTVFPNVPAYLLKKLPSKRKTATSSGGVPCKRRKCDDGTSDDLNLETDASPPQRSHSFDDLDNMRDLPSKYWTKHYIPDAPSVVVFSV